MDEPAGLNSPRCLVRPAWFGASGLARPVRRAWLGGPGWAGLVRSAWLGGPGSVGLVRRASGPPQRAGIRPGSAWRGAEIGDRQPLAASPGRLMGHDPRQREVGRNPGIDRREGTGRDGSHEIIRQEMM